MLALLQTQGWAVLAFPLNCITMSGKPVRPVESMGTYANEMQSLNNLHKSASRIHLPTYTQTYEWWNGWMGRDFAFRTELSGGWSYIILL